MATRAYVKIKTKVIHLITNYKHIKTQDHCRSWGGALKIIYYQKTSPLSFTNSYFKFIVCPGPLQALLQPVANVVQKKDLHVFQYTSYI